MLYFSVLEKSSGENLKDASLMISPGYASGQTELEMREQWTKHWNGVQTENS